MTDEEFAQYVVGLSDAQAASLRSLRSLITMNSVGLDESVTTGRWLNGLVSYSAEGQMIFAMGPKGASKTTLHMIPYYASARLQERFGESLAPFLTGKSCIAFRHCDELPLDALSEIVRLGTPAMINALRAHTRVKNSKRQH